MPTWELKIEKGQKKECRMVNLRLQDCEIQISNFEIKTETETPRCKIIRKKDFETNASEIS